MAIDAAKGKDAQGCRAIDLTVTELHACPSIMPFTGKCNHRARLPNPMRISLPCFHGRKFRSPCRDAKNIALGHCAYIRAKD
jgi:hypothetical protein